ncbi:hypothetical protein B0T13DRAFT_96671 [Neurospora crassa]|nr:hypothetical protein B0T13DRAFT_96671 [Neurospora crassa]
MENAPRIPIGAMVVEAIPKYRRSASLVGALVANFHHRDILTVKMQPPLAARPLLWSQLEYVAVCGRLSLKCGWKHDLGASYWQLRLQRPSGLEKKSHELLEVRGQQDWPVSAVQIVIRANSKKAISKVNIMNTLIFPAACLSQSISIYTTPRFPYAIPFSMYQRN